MKASFSWLRALVPGLPASAHDLAQRFTAAGLEVEAVSVYGAASPSCVVVEVLGTRPHPSKSGLTLVTVDRGDGEAPLEVVCGAPNVPAKGGLVVLAPLGTHLPEKGVTIERRTIAGVASEGMLCSEAELGLSPDAAGILVLPPASARPGQRLAEAFPETHDFILEIGLTPNRPDGLGHIGLAREAAALYALPFTLSAVRRPRSAPDHGTVRDLASVTIEDFERCPRYGASAVLGVTVGPSPSWIRYRLSSLGVRPISNVVDVTNLVLLEYGHPMHAFDLDRLAAPATPDAPLGIVVRRATEGETLETLDKATHTLTPDDLVIADANGAVALAGVMGGAGTEIRETTRRVFLECAYFEARGVRRTARRHGMHTDASHRFERGVDPGDALRVLARARELIEETSGGRAAEWDFEVAQGVVQRVETSLRASRMEQVLGVRVPFEEAVGILERLGFEVTPSGEGVVDVLVPTHRPDVTREIDLIEEVARVRGMDAIPTALPRIRPSKEDAPRETGARRVRAAAVELGLSEAITYSFVSRAALERLGAPEPTVILANPLSIEQEVMRTSLLPGLLDAVARARRHGERDVRLFTVGSVFLGGGGEREHGLPEERLELAVVLAGDRSAYLGKPEALDVWDAKGLAEGLVERVTGALPTLERFGDAELPPYLHPRGGARILHGATPIGRLGPLHPDTADRFEVANGTLVVELDVAALMRRRQKAQRYAPIPRFPASTRDLAVVVKDDVSVGEVKAAVKEAAGALATEVTLFDRFVGGAIEAGHQSLAFRIVYRAADRTLTDKEVETEHEKAVASVHARFGATLRA